jgi:hypothetical protein
MLLNWSQVKAGLDPTRYTLRTAANYVEKATEWQDYCDAERPLEDAIRKFVQDDPSMGASIKKPRKSASTRRRRRDSNHSHAVT